MCNHTNDPGGREAAMVLIDPGTPERKGRDGIWCDPCLVPLITALNAGGLKTIASCCRHGDGPGWVMLADGRWLMMFSNKKEFKKADGVFPDTNEYPEARQAEHRPSFESVGRFTHLLTCSCGWQPRLYARETSAWWAFHRHQAGAR